MNTIEKLCEIFADEFNYNALEITAETSFTELGMDSLDLVEAVMRVEDEFSIEIPDEAFSYIHTVGELCDYIQNLI